jgi:hypothetical protein
MDADPANCQKRQLSRRGKLLSLESVPRTQDHETGIFLQSTTTSPLTATTSAISTKNDRKRKENYET